MDIRVELVITILLGMVALSVPPALSIVLFRGLMKEGIPLDSQKFRFSCLIHSLSWFLMFLMTFLYIFIGGNASMPDRLQTGSIMFASSLILMLSYCFLLLFVLRRIRWAKRPGFIEPFPLHFFFLVYISWAVLFLQYRKYVDGVFW